MKKKVGTIDMTPTWVDTFAVLIDALESGSLENKQMARAELMRAASLLDHFNAEKKQGQ